MSGPPTATFLLPAVDAISSSSNEEVFYGLDVEVEVYKQSFWVSILGLERLGGNESIHSCYSHVAVTQNGVIKPDPYFVAMSENVVLHTKGSGLSGMNIKITKWQNRTNHNNGAVQW